MTDTPAQLAATARAERKPQPKRTVLKYNVPDVLDVLDLSNLVDEWHGLTRDSMPGRDIVGLSYDGSELVVTFE